MKGGGPEFTQEMQDELVRSRGLFCKKKKRHQRKMRKGANEVLCWGG